MIRVSFALVLTLLVLSFGLANAGFRVETDTYTDAYATDFINVFSAGQFRVYHTNTIADRTGWSTPFRFSGTGINLTGQMTATPGAKWDDSLWASVALSYPESWDGDLTTGNGMGGGEYWNYTGLIIPGLFGAPPYPYMVGTPEMLAFTFDFELTGYDQDCHTIDGEFCIDSADMDNATYDWLFNPPEPWGLGPVCFPVKEICNLPAVFDNCVETDHAMQWDEIYSYDFNAHDEDTEPNLPLVFSIASGVGDIDPSTGVYTYNPTCDDVGSQAVTVRVVDALGDGSDCNLTFTVGNTAPEIGGDCGGEATVGSNSDNTVASFTATDDNIGDVLTFDAVILGDADDHTVEMMGGDLVFHAGAVEPVDVTVEVTVTDCDGATATCTFTVHVRGVLPFDIVIEKAHSQYQGHHSYVSILKMDGNTELHGFDFLIGYDASALTFVGAEEGAILTDLEWEYFTYRYNWNGNCGTGCPSGLLRVVAMAESNDGPHSPLGFEIPNGAELAVLDFLVTNDRNFGCMFAAVYFYWMDCGDNTIAFFDATNPGLGIQGGVSEMVYTYGGPIAMYGEFYSDVTNGNIGFPTFSGFQLDCPDGGPDKPFPVPFVDFFGGGVDIICPDEIDDRGDINLNGIANEIADAVVFTNYFIYGLSAFVINPEGQIAATEVNGDGMVLSVADLVYLIRVIVGDALPIPKITPAGDAVFVGGNTSVEVNAAAFTIEGASFVELGAGAAGMELMVSSDLTNALVYTMEPGMVAMGEIIRTDGNLVKIDAADYNGSAYKIIVVPSEFAVKNYPNPFNPTTTVEMSLPIAADYSLSVYNVVGQKVMDLSGFSEAGVVNFDLDFSGYGSGIYFYKVVAGDFSATKKMVLLK